MPDDRELSALYADYAAYSRKREIRNDFAANLRREQRKSAMRQVRILLPMLSRRDVLCDIGASHGEFLSLVRKHVASTLAVEPGLQEQRSLARRSLSFYSSVAECDGSSIDVATLFHSIEHLNDPVSYLMALRQKLRSRGRVVIETPNIDDALLSLYQSGAFSDFYFRLEHCFYYNPRTMDEVFKRAGFRRMRIVPFQRYGLSHHLTWLAGKPGGDAVLEKLFKGIDLEYRNLLIRKGCSDTFMAVYRTA